MSANHASPNSRPALQGETREDITKIRGWQNPAHERHARGELPSMRLTKRELEVLSLLCKGLSNKLIARYLHISSGTVKVHIGNILRELGAASRLHAVVVARQWGLVDAGAFTDPQEPVLPRRLGHR